MEKESGVPAPSQALPFSSLWLSSPVSHEVPVGSAPSSVLRRDSPPPLHTHTQATLLAV